VLLVLLVIGFGISILPFVAPGTIYALFGLVPNRWLGGLVANTLGLGTGSLVAAGGGGPELTLAGVLVVYGLPFLVILFVLRGR
jgi:hypothetical protein